MKGEYCMKHPLKKLLALLLSALMLFTLAPSIAYAGAKTIREEIASKNNRFGYNHVDYHGGRTLTERYLSGEKDSSVRDTLPSSYDSRTYGYITPVKNQNPYGTCWTFGTMAAIEAYMIKHGIINKDTGAAATTSMDLSELHLAWFTYSAAYDKLGMLSGDSSAATYSNYLNNGGTGSLATYTVMRWEGPATENTSALKYSNASTSGVNSQYAYAYDNAHVTDAIWIPVANRDAVKRAIMEYGAATISYYHSDSYFNSSTGGYCYKTNSTVYANHAVTVVGWDDNYSRSNFYSSYGPSGNGAWIIKNSWGTSWGRSGYFYLSYEETASNDEYCYFYKVAPVDNYTNCYQYDGTSNISNYLAMSNNCQVANVFVAQSSEQLTAVALATWDEATSYTLQIYKNPTSSTNPTSGTLMTSQTGYIDYAGYYTIPLNNAVSLSSGDKFAVVFTLSTPHYDSSDGKYVHIPYDASASISWAKWVHTNHGSTSFYKLSNGSWTDVPNNGDIRIKAYTGGTAATPSYTVSAVSNNTSYGTVSVSGNTIIATPANGCYLDDVRVTSGNATLSVDGNTITVEPYSNCTVTVYFAPIPSYTVSAVSNNTSYGNVYVSGNTITAVPASGCYVSDVEVISGRATYSINGNIITVEPDSDCTVMVYFATTQVYTVNAVSNDTSYGSVYVSGNTITAMPERGCYVSNVEVISGYASYSISGNTITVNPSSDCTLMVYFAKRDVYVVKLVACGKTVGKQAAYESATMTLPSSVDVYPEGWTFMGWTEERIDETTSEPRCYEPGYRYTVTGNVTLYALFSKTSGGDETVYELVTEDREDWEGDYVITYGTDTNMLVLKGLSGDQSYQTTSGAARFPDTGMVLTGSVLRNVSNAYVFNVVTGLTSSLKNLETGGYVSSYQKVLYNKKSYNLIYSNWTLSYDGNNSCMVARNGINLSNPYLSASDNGYFDIDASYTVWITCTASPVIR